MMNISAWQPFYGGKLHRVSAEVKRDSAGEVICRVQGEWNSLLEFTYADVRQLVLSSQLW